MVHLDVAKKSILHFSVSILNIFYLCCQFDHFEFLQWKQFQFAYFMTYAKPPHKNIANHSVTAVESFFFFCQRNFLHLIAMRKLVFSFHL